MPALLNSRLRAAPPQDFGLAVDLAAQDAQRLLLEALDRIQQARRLAQAGGLDDSPLVDRLVMAIPFARSAEAEIRLGLSEMPK